MEDTSGSSTPQMKGIPNHKPLFGNLTYVPGVIWKILRCGPINKTTNHQKKHLGILKVYSQPRVLTDTYLGGVFKYVFIFTRNLGEDEPILTNIFFKWVGEKPPTGVVNWGEITLPCLSIPDEIHQRNGVKFHPING